MSKITAAEALKSGLSIGGSRGTGSHIDIYTKDHVAWISMNVKFFMDHPSYKETADDQEQFEKDVRDIFIAAVDSYLNPKSPWKPIGEAPKDGTLILVKEYGEFYLVKWVSLLSAWLNLEGENGIYSFDDVAEFMYLSE